MFKTTNQILSYIKYRNHQKDRNVLPGWYGWYWPHRVSRFNRCELPSYFCCEPIIEFLVPSFLLSFWRVQIAFIRDVLEVDQLTGFSEGKMLMQYYHGETIQSWDVLIYIYYTISIHIYPYLWMFTEPWYHGTSSTNNSQRESWGTLSPVRLSGDHDVRESVHREVTQWPPLFGQGSWWQLGPRLGGFLSLEATPSPHPF